MKRFKKNLLEFAVVYGLSLIAVALLMGLVLVVLFATT